ncbi:MAG: NADH-quinone oxidoreductase subunit M [Phycisphaerales bacterium]|nr:NADH-quinone oxidoreductase subunit M [Phycisphaerales bacterium]
MQDFPLLSMTILSPMAALLLTVVIPARQAKLIKIVNALCALVSVVLALAIWVGYDKSAGGFQMAQDIAWVPSLGIHYSVAVDGVGVVLNLLTAIVFFTGVLSMWSLEKRVKEYFAFMAALVFGVFGVFLSLDLFAFFFFYEVAVLPMYPLIAIWGSTRKEYSAMKLTLFLIAGSALLFPGLVALYMGAGGDTSNILEIAQVAREGGLSPKFQIFLYPFLYIGFGVLAGMFPFHGWSPTGHVAAPTAVSMLHAGVLMKLGAFGIFRIAMTCLPIGASYWSTTFIILATIGVVYGAFVALRQTDFKFVIGFSSVSHMGIVLLGLNTLSQAGIDGAVFQMFAHGIMTALFFSAVGFIYDQTHDRDIRNFGGLASQVPLASSMFIVAGLCGMGVPGFASFWAELLVFIATLQTHPVLGAIAIAGLVFTAAFMLRVLGRAMFGPRNPNWEHLVDANAWNLLPRVILVGVLILFGFFPNLILDMIRAAGGGS